MRLFGYSIVPWVGNDRLDKLSELSLPPLAGPGARQECAEGLIVQAVPSQRKYLMLIPRGPTPPLRRRPRIDPSAPRGPAGAGGWTWASRPESIMACTAPSEGSMVADQDVASQAIESVTAIVDDRGLALRSANRHPRSP